ncbi:MAG: chemotaxis protein CheA [Deltaproteobacteria bacterium]|nr:chemotaxis protein CheA [Deltaproteobacteria bacterium]
MSEEDLAILTAFVQETEDGLNQADQILLSISNDGGSEDDIHALFRVFHTIKGVAGFLDFSDISSLAHTTETLLDLARSGSLVLEGTPLDVVFDATAMMRTMLGQLSQAEAGETSATFEVPELPELLARILREIEAVHSADKMSDPSESVVTSHAASASASGFEEEASTFEAGAEASEAEVEVEVEAEVEVEVEVEVEAAAAAEAEAASVAPPAISDPGTSTASESKRTASAPSGSGAASAAPASLPLGTTAAKTGTKETLKVDVERVDSLFEIIGELVIVESMVTHLPELAALSSPRVRNYLSQLTKITRDLQDIGMRMRMVPLRGLFHKTARAARDISRKAKKRVRIEISGEAAEMDRSMVEQIGDPLVHLIRNAVDHGVESEPARVQQGKPPVATIKLSAYHQGSSVVIELTDDGRGLDSEAILKKARDIGLVGPDQNLPESEIHELIFSPGFSTAARVTDVSGRGVGMDVVKKNVEAMRGRVLVSTEPGRGTTFRMVLPLTLAIIEGMVVRCGTEHYIIPTLSIVESIQPDAEAFHTVRGSSEIFSVRGEVLPLIRLNRVLGTSASATSSADGLVVVIESMGRKVALMVDDVLTQQQVVIKSLGGMLSEMTIFAGAAILSDGRVGLIINVDELEVAAGRGVRSSVLALAAHRLNAAEVASKHQGALS